LEVRSDGSSLFAYSKTRLRANCDEKVSGDTSRGEDERVAAMTGHKKADAG
jgi:hypothetical protein